MRTIFTLLNEHGDDLHEPQSRTGDWVAEGRVKNIGQRCTVFSRQIAHRPLTGKYRVTRIGVGMWGEAEKVRAVTLQKVPTFH